MITRQRSDRDTEKGTELANMLGFNMKDDMEKVKGESKKLKGEKREE